MPLWPSVSDATSRLTYETATRDAPTLAVAMIGAHWGFADPSHFGWDFKAAYGMTPYERRTSDPSGACGGLRRVGPVRVASTSACSDWAADSSGGLFTS